MPRVRKTSNAIGTSPVKIGDYHLGINTEGTVMGLSIANITPVPTTASAFIQREDGVETYLLKDALIPTGNSILFTESDFKLHLIAGDSIWVSAGAPDSVDVTLSVLED